MSAFVLKQYSFTKLTLAAAAGCSHRIGLLAAGRAGNRLAQGGRTANCILAGRHSPAGHTAAEAAGSPVAGSLPGHSRLAGGMDCDPEAGTAAADHSPGCIDRSQTS